MSSGWRRTFGNARSFIGNSMGGLRGGSSLASWGVAGTLAYVLWVRPLQQLKREQEERAALAAASDSYRYVEKRKPIPDPQRLPIVLLSCSSGELSVFLYVALGICNLEVYLGEENAVGGERIF